MAPPIAIVTGGSSGIGAALVEHLVSLGWNVVIADIHQPKHSLPGTLYIHSDVSSWEQQSHMFKQAYEWGKRLDFCALNAGIDDRDDIFNTLSYDLHKPPKKPNTDTFSVNITGTYYGIKLAAHYMTILSGAAGKAKPGARSPSRGPAQASSLPRQITPMSTVLRGFDAVADLAGVAREDWVESGPAGETLEAIVHDLVWHSPPERPQGEKAKASGVSGSQAAAAAAATAELYQDRNRPFETGGGGTDFW
ncbi:hypothetical protein CLAIMM_04835 [Cladophialophora immunda]|nr:hypothetical protein CLAIMM_04835 [Cladophialophora immunda]